MKRRSGLLETLPFADRDRRALKETLADWSFERGSQSGVRRVLADLRGAVAVTSATVRVVAMQVRQPQAWSTIAVALLFAAAVGLILVLTMRPLVSVVPAHVAILLTAALVPQAVGVVLPPVLAVVVACTQKARPLFGSMLGAAVVMTVLGGWVIPESNQWFRQTAVSSLEMRSESMARRPLTRDLPELRLQELIAEAWQGDPVASRAARNVLLQKSALIAWAPVCCLLGYYMQRTLQRRRRSRWAPFAAFALLVVVFVACMPIGGIWLVVGLSTLVSVALARLGRPGGALLPPLQAL